MFHHSSGYRSKRKDVLMKIERTDPLQSIAGPWSGTPKHCPTVRLVRVVSGLTQGLANFTYGVVTLKLEQSECLILLHAQEPHAAIC